MRAERLLNTADPIDDGKADKAQEELIRAADNLK